MKLMATGYSISEVKHQFGKVCLPRKIPSLKQFGFRAFGLRPGASISKSAVMLEIPDRNDDENSGNLQSNAGPKGWCQQVKHGTREKDRKIESWEIMMQEKLTAHQEEWEIMKCPANKEEST